METAIQGKRKIRTVFMLDPENRKRLDNLSAHSGAPLGELLRRSVSTFLRLQDSENRQPNGGNWNWPATGVAAS